MLRAELVRTGVRATLVSPGPVDTALWDAVDPDNRPGFSPRSTMLKPEAVAAAVMNHRMILNYKARFDQVSSLSIVEQLLKRLDEAGLNLPADVVVRQTSEARA